METTFNTTRANSRCDELLSGLEKLKQRNTDYPAIVTVAAPDIHVRSWLRANSGAVRLLWSDRGDLTSEAGGGLVAGIGTASVVTVEDAADVSRAVRQCRALLKGNRQVRFFGGLSFDGNDAWRSFGAGNFFVPRVSLENGSLHLVVMNAHDLERAKSDLERLVFEAASTEERLPAPITTKHSPSFEGWRGQIEKALDLIRGEALEKLVLSRETKMTFAQPLDPIALASRMVETTHDCFVFCFDLGDANSRAFVGASPERLFLRHGNEFHSEVIAGTRKRGTTEQEDELLANDLTSSDKDQREHDIVRKFIRQRLHNSVTELEVDSSATVLRLARKQHLRSNVRGTLRPGVDDAKLLERLHPTPAVGGYPTENALAEISRIEPFNRGWYAAPVGWIGSDSSQFAVAIRSGLIDGDTLSLYSGAGIVEGSKAEEEWDEVESKIQDFVNVLDN